MPLTVTANMMTISHKASNGMSMAFPDVCKTPTPGGPVPIPYPNIAMSSDTTQGSSTVKMDGQPIMLKGSNFKMSTGDEAGSAMGVVSNKIKGKLEFVNYSFDVKADGKNVCRLVDPSQQNMGSPANAFGPAHIQAPLPISIPQFQACEETREKQEEQKKTMDTAWDESGVISEHRPKIQKVVDDEKIVIYFRQTNPLCEDFIRKKHKPKPHEVLKAKTISKGNVATCQQWLWEYFGDMAQEGGLTKLPVPIGRGALLASNVAYSVAATDYFGVVMSLVAGEEGEPLKGYGESMRGEPYKFKWITGDYDLMDIMSADGTCDRPCQNGPAFARIKKALNDAMGWDGIQHGPQAQWVATPKADGVPKKFSMPALLSGWLASPKGTPVPKVTIAAERPPMPACDSKLTAVGPKGGIVYLETADDAKEALKCCGCAR